jgi:hypothetical protein
MTVMLSELPGERPPGHGRETMATTPGEPFSDELDRWLRSEQPKTLGAMGDVFAERSFAVAIMLLMVVPALPLPTGGVTHVFEAITVVLAGEMIVGRRTIWLPKRWQRRELGATTTGKAIPLVVRRIRNVERFSRPRGAGLFARGWMLRLLGLVIMGFAVSAAVAPPFSGLDTLPALGAVAVALAIVLEDVVVLGIGIVVGTGGVVLMLTVGAAIVRLLRGLL